MRMYNICACECLSVYMCACVRVFVRVRVCVELYVERHRKSEKGEWRARAREKSRFVLLINYGLKSAGKRIIQKLQG